MNVDVAKMVGTYKPSPHHFALTGPAPEGDLIAWKCSECGTWVSEISSEIDPGDCPVDWHQQSAQYTVDDLLAWLAVDSYFLAYVSRDSGGVRFDFVNTDSGLDGESFYAPTLLAALEQAVLAVADGTNNKESS